MPDASQLARAPGWQVIVPAVSDAEAKQAYPGGWKAPKPYIRIVPQPR
jgi:hypothetical protein